MYSWEISDVMKKTLVQNDTVIDSEVYQQIIATSPQISRVSYNPATGRFEMWTKDGFYFDFKTYLKQ